jgi:hypothetical protein
MPNRIRCRPVPLEARRIIGGAGNESDIDGEKTNSREEGRESKHANKSHECVAIMAILVYFDLEIVSATAKSKIKGRIQRQMRQSPGAPM